VTGAVPIIGTGQWTHGTYVYSDTLGPHFILEKYSFLYFSGYCMIVTIIVAHFCKNWK